MIFSLIHIDLHIGDRIISLNLILILALGVVLRLIFLDVIVDLLVHFDVGVIEILLDFDIDGGAVIIRDPSGELELLLEFVETVNVEVLAATFVESCGEELLLVTGDLRSGHCQIKL